MPEELFPRFLSLTVAQYSFDRGNVGIMNVIKNKWPYINSL